jgi:hypothetical protein
MAAAENPLQLLPLSTTYTIRTMLAFVIVKWFRRI